jgi:predicted Zn-dependent protease
MLRRKFSDGWWPHAMYARTIARAGKHAQADAVARETVRRFPDETNMSVFYAEIAEMAGDWATAAQRWHEGKERFPGGKVFYTRGSRALLQAGDVPAAAALMAEASFMFPLDEEVLAARTAVIDAGGDPGVLPTR